MKSKNLLKKTKIKQAKIISEIKDIKKLIVKDAVIKPVFVYQNDNADKIMKKLKREDTNVCIVITKAKKYDPITKLLHVGYKKEFLYKKAKELINKHKSFVDINTNINKVIELIYKEGFHYIPVLDKNKKVIGVVTPSSTINLLRKK